MSVGYLGRNLASIPTTAQNVILQFAPKWQETKQNKQFMKLELLSKKRGCPTFKRSLL